MCNVFRAFRPSGGQPPTCCFVNYGRHVPPPENRAKSSAAFLAENIAVIFRLGRKAIQPIHFQTYKKKTCVRIRPDNVSVPIRLRFKNISSADENNFVHRRDDFSPQYEHDSGTSRTPKITAQPSATRRQLLKSCLFRPKTDSRRPIPPPFPHPTNAVSPQNPDKKRGAKVLKSAELLKARE